MQHSQCSTGLNINTGLVPFLGLPGQFGPQVSTYYWPGGANIVSDHFIPLVTGHYFNHLTLPSTPALQLNTIFIFLICVVALYSCYLVLICLTKSLHDVVTSNDVWTLCELRIPIFY